MGWLFACLSINGLTLVSRVRGRSCCFGTASCILNCSILNSTVSIIINVEQHANPIQHANKQPEYNDINRKQHSNNQPLQNNRRVQQANNQLMQNNTRVHQVVVPSWCIVEVDCWPVVSTYLAPVGCWHVVHSYCRLIILVLYSHVVLHLLIQVLL
jgi:hypothetical protein